jgi:hypothetical protein
MDDDYIGSYTDSDLRCVQLPNSSWTLEGGLKLYDPEQSAKLLKELGVPLNVVIDFGGGQTYANKEICEVERVSELNKWNYVGPPLKIAQEDAGQSEPLQKSVSERASQTGNEQKEAVNQTAQQPRAETKQPDNNRPESHEDSLTDDSPSQSNGPRADKVAPETTANSGTPESLGDTAEREVTEFFDEGKKGAPVLKGQFEDYVSEGGNPFLGALGATYLDALNLAMGFAEGTITGILDTRNLGEGVKKGTPEGVKEDAARVLNIAEKIIPEARAVKVLGMALTVSDLTEAAANRDARALAVGGGLAALSLIGGRGGKGNKKRRYKKEYRYRRTEATEAFKQLKKKGLEKVPLSDYFKNQEFGKYQMKQTGGVTHEYVGKLKDGRVVQIDGLATQSNGKLVLIETKFGNPFVKIDNSRHLIYNSGKIDQLKRLAKFAKENSDEIAYVEVKCSSITVAEIYETLRREIPRDLLKHIHVTVE